MIEVLIAHPSHNVRSSLEMKITHLDGITTCSRVRGSSEFFEEVEKSDPDVVLLGTRFEDVSGLDILDVLMGSNPKPVLMISDTEDSETVKSFSYGAIDFISQEESAEDIRALIELADQVKDFSWLNVETSDMEPPVDTGKVVAIGASTGGPGALETVITNLPENFPAPVLIAQHMSGDYISEFSERLDNLAELKVKKAEGGESLEAGKVYISPSDRDMLVVEKNGGAIIKLDEPEGRETPSIDRLFTSVSEFYGSESVSVVLTGMGNDGALGARYLQASGSTLIVQDEQTSAVYGIGSHVVEQGDADKVLPLDEIPEETVRCL